MCLAKEIMYEDNLHIKHRLMIIPNLLMLASWCVVDELFYLAEELLKIMIYKS